MATLMKKTWTSRGPNGHRVRRVAWGYALMVGDKAGRKQERRFDASWSRQDAQEALAKRLLERDAPRAPEAPKTLAEVAQEYLALKRAKGKRTVDEDAAKLRRFEAFFGAGTPIVEITAQRIAQYDRERAVAVSARGRRVSPATINRELATVRHLLRLAEEWGYVAKAPRIRLAKEPEGRLRFLSEEEAVRLLAACGTSHNRYLAAIVTVALYTGMRRGEILGLEWGRVDFSRGVLVLDQTKNGRRREVPMNQAADAALSALPGPRDEGLVFRKRSGAAWGSIRTAFERACREAKLGDFRFHDLRHTCASWLVMAGRSLKEVQELLGHRTFTMTLRYAHLSPDRLRDAVAALPIIAATSTQAGGTEPRRAASPTASRQHGR